MRRFASVAISMMLFAGSLGSRYLNTPRNSQKPEPAGKVLHTYLGFDRNNYPGDAALTALRKTFSFCGYWLNNPPGEASNSWQGKRGTLVANGFGFLVLFNGRLDQELKSTPNPSLLGARDADAAVAAAKKEGFRIGTVIFLDQEEGGRLLSEQRAYVHAWIDGVSASKYGAGVYCSGIPAREANEASVTTAEDIRANSRGRRIIFCVYNDACPPSPGCALPKNPPSPQLSGVPFAAVWQFAQSPRRKDVTAVCSSSYDPDGNCYAPPQGPERLYVDVDVDSAISADPSRGQP
jgi:hypothetical protein